MWRNTQNQYLTTFLINRKRASLADVQKFFPYIAIYHRERNEHQIENTFTSCGKRDIMGSRNISVLDLHKSLSAAAIPRTKTTTNRDSLNSEINYISFEPKWWLWWKRLHTAGWNVLILIRSLCYITMMYAFLFINLMKRSRHQRQHFRQQSRNRVNALWEPKVKKQNIIIIITFLCTVRQVQKFHYVY